MSFDSQERSKFSGEEDSCPLVADVEEYAPSKILYKPKHRIRTFYGFLLEFFHLNFWTLTTCVISIYLLATVGHSQSQYQNQQTYENGYETEFQPARQAISIKKVKFTGGLYFDYNGTLHMSSNPDEPQYIGPPSKEIDDAWEALIHDRYLAITPNQAKEVEGDFWFSSNGFYLAGMDVLHTLHCLNLLRMTQDFDHYLKQGQIEKGPNGRKHIGHCIKHLRQIVQCHGDMTPLPVVWEDIKTYPNGGRSIPDFDQVHTCRDFAALRNWSTEQDLRVKKMARQQLKVSSNNTIWEG